MTLFLSALALLMILEGIPYFAAPEATRRVLAELATRPSGALRGLGFVLISIGVGLLVAMQLLAG